MFPFLRLTVISACVLLVGMANSVCAQNKKPRNAKAPQGKLLIIINGESNSGGYALNTEATAAELAPRPSVRILNNATLKSFDVLDIGANNIVGHTGLEKSDTHGFELQIANRADSAPAKLLPVYLVKVGHGGSTIAQWAPGGGYYKTFLDRIGAAKVLLQQEQVRPVVLFSLGINDAIAGTKLDVWKPAVKAHFENLRKELGPDTPIIMTRFMPKYASYNTAIEALCKEIPNVYSVNTLDAPLRDANHWNYEGMKLVTNRMLDVVESLNAPPEKAKSKAKEKAKAERE